MNAEILPEQLLPVAQTALRVSNPTGVRPIYGCVQVGAVSGMVLVSAVNESCQFQGRAQAQAVTRDGAAVVDSKRLRALLQSLAAGEPTQLEVKDGFLHLGQGSFQAKLPHYGNETFPELTVPPGAAIPLTDAAVAAISRVAACVEDGPRSSYPGILFDFSAQYLRIFGVGLRQLHFFQVPCPHLDPAYAARIVLSKSAQLIPEGTGVTLVGDSSGVLFTGSNFSLRVSTLNDTLPHGYVELLGAEEVEAGRLYSRPLRTDPEHPGQPMAGGERVPRWWAEFDRQEFLDAFLACSGVLDEVEFAVELALTEFGADGDRIVGRTGLLAENVQTGARASKVVLCRAERNDRRIRVRLPRDAMRDTLRELQSALIRMWFHDDDLVLLTEVYDTPPGHNFVAAVRPVRG